MAIKGEVVTRTSIKGNARTSPVINGELSNNVEENTSSSIRGEVVTQRGISGTSSTTSAINGNLSDVLKDRIIRDYNQLFNKPSIEGVQLIGNRTLDEFGIPLIYTGTTAEWSEQTTLVSKPGALYIYTDRMVSHGKNVPGFKVGDGNAYVVDLPFSDDPYYEHIMNTVIHVTQEDKDYWSDKVTCYIDSDNPDLLIFTKE